VSRGADRLFVASFSLVFVWWNLLRIASLFLGQIPVDEKDYKTRVLIQDSFQGFQNIKKKSPFLMQAKP
jgi:hypothetical protein